MIENENKKQVETLETRYKFHLDTLANTYESKIKEIEQRNQDYMSEFDENYSRFKKELSLFVANHIEKVVHEEILLKSNQVILICYKNILELE